MVPNLYIIHISKHPRMMRLNLGTDVELHVIQSIWTPGDIVAFCNLNLVIPFTCCSKGIRFLIFMLFFIFMIFMKFLFLKQDIRHVLIYPFVSGDCPSWILWSNVVMGKGCVVLPDQYNAATKPYGHLPRPIAWCTLSSLPCWLRPLELTNASSLSLSVLMSKTF